MEQYANKFLELLRYVRYIKNEKVKIKCFLSGLPQYYKDRIEFYEPRNLEEAIRKAKYCYEKIKNKPDHRKTWKNKMNEKSYRRRKVTNLLTLGINTSNQHKLRSSQLEQWERSQKIHNKTEHHSNVGNVEDPTCARIVHSRMRVQGQLTNFKRQKQWVK